MLRYMARRFLISIVVLMGVSLIVFTLMNLQPGDPYSTSLDPSISKEVRELRLREIGYYDPLPVKYMRWLKRTLSGDLGYSLKYKVKVSEKVGEAFRNTLLLAVPALLISSVLAVLLGVLSIIGRRTPLSRILDAFSTLGISFPTFFIGLILIRIFAIGFKILPASGMYSIERSVMETGGYLRHLILPMTVISVPTTSLLYKYVRASMGEEMGKDYIRTALSKGRGISGALIFHVLKNTMISFITVLSLQIPAALSGALITETIFVWPGMGTLNYNAVLSHDYPLIMGLTMTVALLIIGSSLLADILYTFMDPRISLTGGDVSE